MTDDDDIGRLLIASIDAIHRENTRQPIHCAQCGVTFLKANAYFDHCRSHHPSAGRAS